MDDIDALREGLIQRGVTVTPNKLGCDQTRQCWCRNRDGKELEFQQYTPTSAQITRTNCIVAWQIRGIDFPLQKFFIPLVDFRARHFIVRST